MRASGKWAGREVVKAVHNDTALTLIGGIDPKQAGEDLGIVAGIGALNLSGWASLENALVKDNRMCLVDLHRRRLSLKMLKPY